MLKDVHRLNIVMSVEFLITWGYPWKKILLKVKDNIYIFTEWARGQFSLVVAMSVCGCVCPITRNR